jgi:hypothetical protein
MKRASNILLLLSGIVLGILIENRTDTAISGNGTNYTINIIKNDTLPGIHAYMLGMRQIEASENYQARRRGCEYIGAYQIGNETRTKLGFGYLNNEVGYLILLSDSKLQDSIMIKHIKRQLTELDTIIKKYNGKQVGRWHITTSGITAMAHLVGNKKTIEFLTKCKISYDGNHVPITDYLQMNGYDLTRK